LALESRQPAPHNTGRRLSRPNATYSEVMTRSDPAALQRRREAATRASFFIAGAGLSAWAPLVPYARDRLHAGEAELGLLMLALGIGSIVAMPLAGLAAARFGCRRLITTVALVCCAVLPWLAVAPDYSSLVPLLLIYGACLGSMDVAINLHAVLVERGGGRALMSGFHGCFSVGCIAGAGGIAALLWAGTPPWLAVLVLVAVVLAGLIGFARQLLGEGGDAGAGWRWPHGRLLLLGAMCFATFLSEGAMLDWSAVALNRLQDVPTAHAGMGFAIFAVAMTIGRFRGDAWVVRYGPARLLAVGTAVAVAGMALAVWSPSALAALAGYALVGLGSANIAPIVFSAAGRQSAGNTQAAVAAISTMGYSGSLAGPAAIGFLAHVSSLPVALSCVAAGLALAVLAGRSAAVSGH
jgi:fucose permease